MTGSYYFNADYVEDAILSDGTRVRLRLIRPSDADMLAKGFERLSPESRYRRFLGVKNSLSPAELRYLTEVDGVEHFAIGAVRVHPTEGEDGLGIARFIRKEDKADTAEPAIAVIDEMQGKGLGRLLIQRLVAAALERGIQRFRSELLVSNEPVQALLHDIGLDRTTRLDGEIMSIEVPLPPLPPDHPPDAPPRQSSLYQLFVLAAKQLIVRLRTIGRMKDEG